LARLAGARLPDFDEQCLLYSAIGLGLLQFLPFALFALRIGGPAAVRTSVGILALPLARVFSNTRTPNAFEVGA